jgi:hypothetical protein
MDNPDHNPYTEPLSTSGEAETTMHERTRNGRPESQSSRPEVETLQRVRRIETRVTQLLVGMGINTQAQRPTFNCGNLTIPSLHSSLKEVIDSIPESWRGPVDVFLGERLVVTLAAVRGN